MAGAWKRVAAVGGVGCLFSVPVPCQWAATAGLGGEPAVVFTIGNTVRIREYERSSDKRPDNAKCRMPNQ